MPEFVDGGVIVYAYSGKLHPFILHKKNLLRTVKETIIQRGNPVVHREGSVFRSNHVLQSGLQRFYHTEKAQKLPGLHRNTIRHVPVHALICVFGIIDVVRGDNFRFTAPPNLSPGHDKTSSLGKGNDGPGFGAHLTAPGIPAHFHVANVVVVPAHHIRSETARMSQSSDFHALRRGGCINVIHDPSNSSVKILHKIVRTPPPGDLVEESSRHTPVGELGGIPIAGKEIRVKVCVVGLGKSGDILHVFCRTEAGEYFIRHTTEGQVNAGGVKLRPCGPHGGDLEGVLSLLKILGVDGTVVGVELLRPSSLNKCRRIVPHHHCFDGPIIDGDRQRRIVDQIRGRGSKDIQSGARSPAVGIVRLDGGQRRKPRAVIHGTGDGAHRSEDSLPVEFETNIEGLLFRILSLPVDADDGVKIPGRSEDSGAFRRSRHGEGNRLNLGNSQKESRTRIQQEHKTFHFPDTSFRFTLHGSNQP